MTDQVCTSMSPEEFLDLTAEEMRASIAGGAVPPQLSDEQIKQLSPTVYDEYCIARETAGEADIWGRLGAVVRAGASSAETRAEVRRELESGDYEYRDGLPASDGNYRGIDHQKLKADIDVVDVASIEQYSDRYHNMFKILQDLADAMKESVGKSRQEWEGDAADGAHNYFTTLGTWADGGSQNARMASETIYSESHAASAAKNSMPEPVPFSMNEEMGKWMADPFSMHEAVEQTLQRREESQRAHDEAVRVMHQYDTQLYDAGNKQPVFPEPPTFGGADAAGDSSRGVIRIDDGGQTKASGFVNGTSGVGGPGGAVPAAGGGGGVSTPSGGGGGYSPPPVSGPSTGVRPPGETGPSGLVPGGPRPAVPGGRVPGRGGNGFGPGAPGAGTVGAMPVGGGFGPGGGAGGGAGGGYGAGRAGGFGPGGAPGAGGPGAGSGAATGAKPTMGGAAAGAAAGAPGAGGRGGGMGGAPMGAGGGRGGQGGEDEEHQRPTYLVEADPDDVFGTDERTAPPVIGA